jgi:hypothetical protein
MSSAYIRQFTGLSFSNTALPEDCKYFNESGFKLTTAHRNYGHGLVGEKCVEVGRLVDNPNTILNLLVSFKNRSCFNTVFTFRKQFSAIFSSVLYRVKKM